MDVQLLCLQDIYLKSTTNLDFELLTSDLWLVTNEGCEAASSPSICEQVEKGDVGRVRAKYHPEGSIHQLFSLCKGKFLYSTTTSAQH